MADQYDDSQNSNQNGVQRRGPRTPSPPYRDRSRSPINRRRDSGGRGGGGRGRNSRDGTSEKRVFVSNIPYEMRWQDIKDLFREKVGEVTYVELFETSDGKSNGTGIIEFRDAATAGKAIEEMHKYEYKGRKIIVREERDSDRRRHMRNMDYGNDGGLGIGGGNVGMGGGSMGMGGGNMGMSGGGNMGMSGGGNMPMSGNSNYGSGGNMGGVNVSQQFLQQLGVDGPVTNQCFVANLDYKVTKDKLLEIFKMAGNVIRAELKEDKDGKSRGMGVVQFEHPMEAIQAISMFNGQILYERAMSVRMDKMADVNTNKPPQLPSGLKSIGMGLGSGGTPLSNISQLANQVNLSSVMTGSLNTGMSSNLNVPNNMGTGMGNMGNTATTQGMNTGLAGMMGNTGLGGLGDMSMGNMGNMPTGMSNMATGMGNMGNMGMTGTVGGTNMGGFTGDSMGGMGMANTGLGNMGNMNTGLTGMTGNMDNFLGNTGMGIGNSMDNFRGGNQSVGSGRQNMGGNRRNQDGCTVFVRNLPYSITWQQLKERFRDCGDVKFAEIKMENGKSRGCGTVRFTNPEDARRAINVMNGNRIDGRDIEVRLDR